jgi:hypothetical protein
MSPELRDDPRRRPEYEQAESESNQHERTHSRLPSRIAKDHPQQPGEQSEQAETDRNGDHPSDDRGERVEHTPSVGQTTAYVFDRSSTKA